ncbi:CPBP family intramembrane metalloprotease [Listeria sp. FSL L7-1485]|uniref:CPBP family intramembrane metalloprotease n=1 Tax=Listeria immobilis TaxID=2713502 RepID=A0A7X0X546_9LIST|nr:type II CAAX endopeptidase family protein [Listeria immobilis]MBC1487573.1 CPBP family intramembrane metalloprotease [Listeria immobilis]MBC1507268.1 CPBP family intramembrane metalloprotease [Listeria immobilis]MBC1510666.1 CPBP family intramembrane metalloprotease [Listeria immobilis]MBC1534668.1 CPBP family intramembrane metalloprotease [Listeria immobilis]MBC6296613.1 CPBP family intramembrane metalloprotease [Listeria immobilis]
MKKYKYLAFLIAPLQIILQFVIVNWNETHKNLYWLTYLGIFLPILLCFLISIYLFKDVLKKDRKDLKTKWWKMLLIGVIGTIILQMILIFGSLAVGETTNFNAETATLMQLIFILICSMYGLLTAVTEELYFRYLFFSISNKKSAKVVLLFISSLLFGFAHYWSTNSFEQLIPYFFAGLFLGCIYLVTKNIWYTIIIHLINNFYAIVLPAIMLLVKYLTSA